MATITKDFDFYRLRLQGGTTKPANVICYAGNTLVGSLIFHDLGDTKNPKVDANGRLTIYMVPSLLGPTLDVLRNEKPLQLWAGQTLGVLMSGQKEPVGEAAEA